jgi:TatD DNase family protein
LLIDTHTHIYLEDFSQNIAEIISNAKLNGVEKFLLPAIDSLTFPQLLQLQSQYPNQCYAMAGLHPCSVKHNYLTELNFVLEQLKSQNIIAVGEIGLDYYWDTTFEKQQQESFNIQMQYALDFNLPISIHTRNAMGQTIEMVKPFAKKGLKGIFHCFSGSYESAIEIINMGFLLGIGGVVTYKNAGLAEVLQKVDLKYLVLETDAPYLTPVPFRGKQNQPSYIIHIAEKIAEIKQIDIQQIASITTSNAISLFSL